MCLLKFLLKTDQNVQANQASSPDSPGRGLFGKLGTSPRQAENHLLATAPSGKRHCDRLSGAQIGPQCNQWVSTVQWGRDQRAHDENDTPALGHLRETGWGGGGQHSSIMITRSDNSKDLQNGQHRKAAPYCKRSR